MNLVITLTTDFGTSDGFVGMMKGVILSINPQASIVDITHDIAPQNVEQGAFVLAASSKYFPPNAIHVVVVDPGVGSERQAIAIQFGETVFVAPDNGILSPAISSLQSLNLSISNVHVPISAVRLNRPQYWLPRVSNTFHGRDIFAPCAAHLSLGVPLEALGEPITDWVKLPSDLPARRPDGAIEGRVVHVDRFGNIVTNIGEDMLRQMEREKLVVKIAGRKISGLKRSYAEGAPSELFALVNSAWLLEIAQRDGNAAKVLGAQIGEEVVVST
jgi:S-adenosyl-L-methionine hydrolase (adenosine-forming)